jgi:hypothetical protein
MTASYGNIARTNGLKFEQLMVDHFNKIENKTKFVDKIKLLYPDITLDGFFVKCPSNKVESLIGKKTTRKADIWYCYNDTKLGISVKMSNKGTQYQIISLNNFVKILETKYDSIMDIDTNTSFKKFLGLIEPSPQQLKLLQVNRKPKLKYKKRFWMHEIDSQQQDLVINFLKNNYSNILKIILSNGVCKNIEDTANIFIFNNDYYSKTKNISPVVLLYDELVSKISGECKITNLGNLELSRFIGLQQKGSGNKYNKTCLQFKDRGSSKILMK